MDKRIDEAPCGYLSLSHSRVIIDVNLTLCYLLDYEVNQLPGMQFESILTRASRIIFQIYFEPLIKLQGKVDEMNLLFKTSNGDEVPMLVNLGIRERNGEKVYDCILIPLRQRMEYEKQVQKAELASRKAKDELRQLSRAVEVKREELDLLTHLVNNVKKFEKSGPTEV
ncbi:PAS domain-containing protein [Paenibacillus albidus]|uniref:PAS domain-containing protein n=1 Tax=Paenibacillus albidus TaxID=2041023 RepID=UPI001BE92CBF|nr:PAS domain-containing protein [Paenibacillus albidus]MBT2290988.1 PAS domain-containing protein [Paenibacillus albidus]